MTVFGSILLNHGGSGTRHPGSSTVVLGKLVVCFQPIRQVRASALKPKLEEKLSFSLWAEAKREEMRCQGILTSHRYFRF